MRIWEESGERAVPTLGSDHMHNIMWCVGARWSIEYRLFSDLYCHCGCNNIHKTSIAKQTLTMQCLLVQYACHDFSCTLIILCRFPDAQPRGGGAGAKLHLWEEICWETMAMMISIKRTTD